MLPFDQHAIAVHDLPDFLLRRRPRPPVPNLTVAELSLAEELVLLALDEDGSIPPLRVGELLDIALAGAQLLDLTLQEQVKLKNSRIETAHLAPPSGTALRRSLSRIAEQPKPRKPASMIFKLTKGLRKALLGGLADRGLVGTEEDRTLGVFPTTRYPKKVPQVADEIRGRLRRVLLEGATPDPRTAGLIAVIRATHLESLVLDRPERKAAKARLKELALPQGAPEGVTKGANEVVKGLREAIAAISAG